MHEIEKQAEMGGVVERRPIFIFRDKEGNEYGPPGKTQSEAKRNLRDEYPGGNFWFVEKRLVDYPVNIDAQVKMEKRMLHSKLHKQSRNELCSCGSNRKFKKCCGRV